MDLHSHRRDLVGQINEDIRITVKNSLSLFEYRFQLRLSDAHWVYATIAWLNAQGEPYSKGYWPAGHKLEEVIVAI